LIPDITELNFPKIDGKQYATLTQATVNVADMGEKSITTQVEIDGEIVPDFSQDWEVEFQGEKYIMPLRIPQGAKENTSLNSTIDLTFQHWAIYQLKRWPFVTIQQIAAGTYLPDEEVATVQLNLKDFCILFGQVLEYYYGDAITIDLNPAWQYKQEATIITISHTKIWNVLIDAFYGKYGVRWELKAASENSNTVKGGERYVIRVGYPTTEVDHIFEYGFEGGLLKVERQVQSEEIHNMLKGRGGETNIPFRYFKNTDPNNPDFRPDPDWVEELANIPFTNLMPATFRSYVQGWKAAHISKYPGYTAVGESNAYAPWAYRKGYTDTKFAPVEFVADEITINPATGDKQVEILPGYSPYVKAGSSIAMYGPLPDTLDNNDDIYPTLQGTGLDIAVAVEQMTEGDSNENDGAVIATIAGTTATVVLNARERRRVAMKRIAFSVHAGKTANLETAPAKTSGTTSAPVLVKGTFLNVYSANGEKRSASGIPAGEYLYEAIIDVYNPTDGSVTATVTISNATLTEATPSEERGDVFDVWIRNVWNSAKQPGETDGQYSERVWKPVLGNREGNEAKVMFTSGMLAHEDYEFRIVGFPVYDASKSYTPKDSDGNAQKDENGDAITYTSHWRLTLGKSDAEYEATGKLIPNPRKQGKAGDLFVFTGTEMTHVPYVTNAEIRLDDWKKDQLAEKKDIKPTYAVSTDRVRLNNEGKAGALIEELRAGNSIRLADSRFIQPVDGMMYETLYLQSITYKYRKPDSNDTALNPDVEIVLGEEYATSKDTVSLMQGEINALQRQVGSVSNVEQIAVRVGDRRYARKETGVTDRIGAVWEFLRQMHSQGYNADALGNGWWLGMDADGYGSLTIDKLYVRYKAVFDALEIRHIMQAGGVVTLSPAGGAITSVEEAEVYLDKAVLRDKEGKTLRDKEGRILRVPDAGTRYATLKDKEGKVLRDKNGKTLRVKGRKPAVKVWRCRLRTSDGEKTITNDFRTGDLVQCRTFNLATGQRFYWRLCVGVGADWIDLSMTDCAPGSDTPMTGDEIVAYGNRQDKERQNAISMAAYGNGTPSITLYQGIDSYSTDGKAKTAISPYGSKFTGDFIVRTEDGGETGLAEFLSDRISLTVRGAEADYSAGPGRVESGTGDSWGVVEIPLKDNITELAVGTRLAVSFDIDFGQEYWADFELYVGGAMQTMLDGNDGGEDTRHYDLTLTVDGGLDDNPVFELTGESPDNAQWFAVSNLSVKRIPLERELRETGIDIQRGKITLKGDTEIITNDGNTAALFEKGKIKAEYVEAAQVSAVRLETTPLSDTAKAHTVIEGGRQVYYDDSGDPRLIVHSGQISDGNSGAGEQITIVETINSHAATVRTVTETLLSKTVARLSVLDLSGLSILAQAALRQGSNPLPDFGGGAWYGNVTLTLHDTDAEGNVETLRQMTLPISGTGTRTLTFGGFGKITLSAGAHTLGYTVGWQTALEINGEWQTHIPSKRLPLARLDTATEIAANGAALRAGQNYVRAIDNDCSMRFGDYILRVTAQGIEASGDGGATWEWIYQ
jgi:hypothetical protein